MQNKDKKIAWEECVLRLVGLAVVLASTALGQGAPTSSGINRLDQALPGYCDDQQILLPQDTTDCNVDPAVLPPEEPCEGEGCCLPSEFVEPATPDECWYVPGTGSQDYIRNEPGEDQDISPAPSNSCNTDDCLIVPYSDPPGSRQDDTEVDEPPQSWR